ncbi:MAG: tail fiber domain-containing protein, partial [Bacteroidota bacterium]
LAGTYNVAVGYHALNGNSVGTTQVNNVALGSEAGFKNQSGQDNVFVGNLSGYSNISGSYNLFFGNNAGNNNTSGYNNIFMGDHAGYLNTIGDNNFFVGINSGHDNINGYQNTFLGASSGEHNINGHFNLFVGYYSGNSNVTGAGNSFIGYNAGLNNNSGSDNSFVGGHAGSKCISGTGNSCFGLAAGDDLNPSGSNGITTGHDNTMIGMGTGGLIAVGDRNTYLGAYSGASGDFSNSSALGSNAIVGANNSMVLGDNSVNVGIGTSVPTKKLDIRGDVQVGDPTPWSSSSQNHFINFGDPNYVYIGETGADDRMELKATQYYFSGGNIGLGTATPSSKLEVCGNTRIIGTLNVSGVVSSSTGITCSSDRRLKKNILPLTNVLNEVKKLQGVSYKWRKEEFPTRGFTDSLQIGLIAQDVEKIFPQLVFTDSEGYKTVDYSRLTPLLIEAIKEQQKMIDELKNINRTQNRKLERLNEQVTSIQKELNSLKIEKTSSTLITENK